MSFTAGERPASTGDSLTLRPFAADADRDLFAARTEDMESAGDGSGAPAGDLDDEIRAAVSRVSKPTRRRGSWRSKGTEKVGMVFGELARRRGQRPHLDTSRTPQARLRHRRAAPVTLADGRVLPGGPDGRARTGRDARVTSRSQVSARAGIVVTGTEVLTGRVADRNGPWLADRLLELGVELAHITICGDRPADIAGAAAVPGR